MPPASRMQRCTPVAQAPGCLGFAVLPLAGRLAFLAGRVLRVRQAVAVVVDRIGAVLNLRQGQAGRTAVRCRHGVWRSAIARGRNRAIGNRAIGNRAIGNRADRIRLLGAVRQPIDQAPPPPEHRSSEPSALRRMRLPTELSHQTDRSLDPISSDILHRHEAQGAYRMRLHAPCHARSCPAPKEVRPLSPRDDQRRG
jgi:hypothetical protein